MVVLTDSIVWSISIHARVISTFSLICKLLQIKKIEKEKKEIMTSLLRDFLCISTFSPRYRQSHLFSGIRGFFFLQNWYVNLKIIVKHKRCSVIGKYLRAYLLRSWDYWKSYMRPTTRGSFTDHFFKSIGQNDLGDILSTSYFCSFTLGGL